MIFKSASHYLEEKIQVLITKRPGLIEAARNWVNDCEWTEAEEEDPSNSFVDEFSPMTLLKLVDRHYDRGLKGFVGDNSY